MEHKNYKQIYSKDDLKILKIAEDSLDPKLDRVNEIIAYCKEAGIRKVGLANCISFEKQAKTLENILTSNELEVDRANCKLVKIKFHDLLSDYKGTSCDPAGQAEYLGVDRTELNVMMGLCLGHDIIFNSKSKVPVTPLIVEDRKLDHNPLVSFKN